MKQGLVQVYTGNGKGKTTTAVGLLCRAVNYGLKICYVHFHKEPGRWAYGEINILKKLGVTVLGCAHKHPHFYKNITKEEIRKNCLGMAEKIKGILKEKKYDIVVLDEILISIRDGYLTENEVAGIIKAKPKTTELVLTGRSATKKIIGMADLVSEIREVKHPYHKGIMARRGIEF